MKIFYKAALISTLIFSLAACGAPRSKAQNVTETQPPILSQNKLSRAQQPLEPISGTLQQAIVAGGCFWCVESDFEKVEGVAEVISGYSGGYTDNPTYKQVSYKKTGHYEVVKILFDPKLVSYRELVDHYWETVDPTDAGGQFCDRGQSYKTAIFATPDQVKQAQESKAALIASNRLKDPIVTPILEAVTFYPAEGYHQDYYKKNPLRYRYYRNGCGRDKRLKRLWG